MKTIYCPCSAWLLKIVSGKVVKARQRCLVLDTTTLFIEGAGAASLVGRTEESLSQTTIRCTECGRHQKPCATL